MTATHNAMIQTRLPSRTRSRFFQLGLALLTTLTLLCSPSAHAGEDSISVNPNFGPQAGGNSVVITLQFYGGSSSIDSIFFGQNPATFQRNGNTITVSSVPANNSAGPVPLTVNYSYISFSPDEDTAAALPQFQVSTTYTYVASPTIINVSPPSIPAIVPTGGTEITLTGTNLAGITQITGFSPAAITPSSATSTEVKFTIPAGTYPVGSGGAYSADPASGTGTSFAFTFIRVGNPVLTVNRFVPGATTPNNVGLITLRAPSGTFTALNPTTAATQTSRIRPGTVVTLIAAAKTGFVFDSWGGEDSSIGTIAGRSISFTMPEDDVTLDADFITNPFTSLIGTPIFRGVLAPEYDTESSNATYGSVVVTLSKTTGDFSGNLLIDGRNLPIRGYILGDNSIWFIQGPATAPVTSEDFTFDTTKTLNLCLCSGLESPYLECIINHDSTAVSTDVAAFLGDSTSYGNATLQLTTIPESVLNRASVVGGPIDQGYFTAILSARGIDGDCPAFITISNTGRVSIIGNLADGTSLTMATSLCEVPDNSYITAPSDSPVAAAPIGPFSNALALLPLHSQLRTPGGTATQLGGSLLGYMYLGDSMLYPTDLGDAPVAGDPLPVALSITGEMIWIRPSVTQVAGTTATARATQIYTEGWPEGLGVFVIGTQYNASITVQDALLGSSLPLAPAAPVAPPAPGNAVLSFDYGKLPDFLSFNSFNILGSTVSKIAPIDRKYSLVLNQRLGQISGSFTPTWTPRSSAPTTFTGILIQSIPFIFGPSPSAGFGGGFFISNQPGDLDPVSGQMSLSSARGLD
jgi:hypothetical protein